MRWGPGSIAVVLALIVGASLALYEALRSGSTALYFAGGLLLFIDAVIVAVKLSERIVPAKKHDERLEGTRGVVMLAIEPPRPGVVKVGSELWSAMADKPIAQGAEVIVVRRSGLYLYVRQAEEREQ